MKPVRQTRFGPEDGNCFEACLASVLDLADVDQVPRYTESNQDIRPYLRKLDGWLSKRGLRVVSLRLGDNAEVDYVGGDTYWIAFVETATNVHHAVVRRGYEFEWDPQHCYDPAFTENKPLAAAVFIVRE